jgi:hypothetical protein
MQDIIQSIQQDILDPLMPLINILLKAKVLAYQLENDNLKQWVKNELDGYHYVETVPDYRVLYIESIGTFFNGVYMHKHQAIPRTTIPQDLLEHVRRLEIREGVHALDEMGKKDQLQSPWTGDWIAYYNSHNEDSLDTYHLVEAHRPILGSRIAQIVQVTRSRLQDFILEISDLPWNIGQGSPPASQIDRLLQVTIYNSVQGGSMSTFDQRGQQVQYQYNAAGNINFGAIQDRTGLVQEMEKLKDELLKAAGTQIIDAEVVTDSEYQLTKAIQQAKKPEPDKAKILEHLNGAKTLIESVAAASGLVTGFLHAAELVQKFF